PHRFLGVTGWPSCFLASSSLRGTTPTLLSQRRLELLRRNTRSCSLVPRHLRAILAVDEDELLLGRTARELEQPESLRAILADNALWQRLSRSRLRILLSLCFGTSLITHLAICFVCHVLP